MPSQVNFQAASEPQAFQQIVHLPLVGHHVAAARGIDLRAVQQAGLRFAFGLVGCVIHQELHQLLEIMMAQDFHDLTGQVIARVVNLAANKE